MTCRKINAVLLIAMLAVDEIRQVQSHIRFNHCQETTDVRSKATNVIGLFGVDSVAVEMEDVFADISAAVQMDMWMAGTSFCERAKDIAEQAGLRPTYPTVQKQVKLFSQQMDKLNGDPTLREQAHAKKMKEQTIVNDLAYNPFHLTLNESLLHHTYAADLYNLMVGKLSHSPVASRTRPIFPIGFPRQSIHADSQYLAPARSKLFCFRHWPPCHNYFPIARVRQPSTSAVYSMSLGNDDAEREIRGGNEVMLISGLALLLVAVDRVIFAVALLPMSVQLSITTTQQASLLSAFLVGYAMTNTPGGMLADRVGGIQVLLGSLALWSLSVVWLPFAARVPDAMAALLLSRFLFGVASGPALPATGSIIAKWMPANEASSGLGYVTTLFNLGSAVGFLLGGLIPSIGWPALFYIAGTAGLLLSVFGILILRDLLATASVRKPGATRANAAELAKKVRRRKKELMSRRLLGQLACMVYVSCVINWAFFIIQNWLPRYMSQELGLDLSKSASLSALPWAMLAVFSTIAGRFSDALLRRGWAALRVRQLMITISGMFPALCLLILAYTKNPIAASALLMTALGSYGFSTSGHQAHIQDVAPRKSGMIFGFANTVGVIVAIGAQQLTGFMVAKYGSFRQIFVLTSMLCISQVAVFCRFMSGEALFNENMEG